MCPPEFTEMLIFHTWQILGHQIKKKQDGRNTRILGLINNSWFDLHIENKKQTCKIILDCNCDLRIFHSMCSYLQSILGLGEISY